MDVMTDHCDVPALYVNWMQVSVNAWDWINLKMMGVCWVLKREVKSQFDAGGINFNLY